MSNKISNKEALMRAVGDLSEGVLDPEMAEIIAEGLISRGFVVDEDALREKHGVSTQPAPKSNNHPSAHDLAAAIVMAGLPAPTLGQPRLDNHSLAHRLFKNLCRDTGKNPIEVIQARKNFGLDKYGSLLQPFNGRNSLEDALDEIADAFFYLTCIEYEKEASK